VAILGKIQKAKLKSTYKLSSTTVVQTLK